MTGKSANDTAARESAPAKGEYVILDAPPGLRDRVRVSGSGSLDTSIVERAEKALEDLAGNFSDWMNEETDRLVAACRHVNDDRASARARQDLFRAAHDIKGEAGTLGFPMAGRVAGSLCDLIEAAEEARIDALPLRLVNQHVDAVRAIVGENARGHDRTAARLADRLIEVTRDYLGDAGFGRDLVAMNDNAGAGGS